MSSSLRDVVLKPLEKAADENNEWYPLVMAALEGQSELQKQRIPFLRSVTVEGFRKSSFAEGLELLLTGETYRWENRSKVTRTLALEGEKGPCAVTRGWKDEAELDDAETWAQVPKTGSDRAQGDSGADQSLLVPHAESRARWLETRA